MLIYSLLMLSWLTLLSMQEILKHFKKKRFRRWWVKPDLTEENRRRFGHFTRKFRYFKQYDHEEFYNFVGMPVEQFDILHRRVRPKLVKKGPRATLDPELRLAVVLSFLVHKASARKKAWSFCIGRSTMYKLIPEVCKAIHDSLKKDYLKFPSTQEEWLEIADGFQLLFDMPNCLGAVDGKHFEIYCPPHSGSWFWNFKKFYSVVLMAIVDSRRVFRWVSAGDFGSLNDTDIFRNSNLGRALEADAVPIVKKRRYLPNSRHRMSMFFIGDGGFPLKKYLMRPYKIVRDMLLQHRLFNVRLGNARRIVERAFGTLVKKFKVFKSPLDFNLKTTELIIMATVCLHNFLIIQDEYVQRKFRYLSTDEESSDESDEEGEDGNENVQRPSEGDAPLREEHGSEASFPDSGASCADSEASCADSGASCADSVASSADSLSSSSDSLDGSSNEDECMDVSSPESIDVSDGGSMSTGSDIDGDEEVLDDGPSAREMQDQLSTYFTSLAGSVPWQYKNL